MKQKDFNETHLYCNFQEEHPMASKLGAEVVIGRQKLKNIEKAISVFGGARAKEGSWEYTNSYKLAKNLAQRGISVISGGGPGIMEAANRGAQDANNEAAKAIGLNINIKSEITEKKYQDISVDFNYFASRKITFCAHSDAFVVAPGGFGTLDELFEVITLMQTDKSEIVPIILMGEYFWNGLMDWVHESMVKSKLLSQEHYDLIEIAKDWEDVITKLEQKNII